MEQKYKKVKETVKGDSGTIFKIGNLVVKIDGGRNQK